MKHEWFKIQESFEKWTILQSGLPKWSDCKQNYAELLKEEMERANTYCCVKISKKLYRNKKTTLAGFIFLLISVAAVVFCVIYLPSMTKNASNESENEVNHITPKPKNLTASRFSEVNQTERALVSEECKRKIFGAAKLAEKGEIVALKEVRKCAEILKQENKLDERYGERWTTVLMWAAGNAHLEIIGVRLKAGAEIDVKTNNGLTALMWGADTGNLESVKHLLGANAEIDAKDYEGKTALMWAAERGHLETVKFLLEAKANIDVKSNNGSTALMRAALMGHLETVKFLLKANANIDFKNNDPETAAEIAEALMQAMLKSDQLGYEEVERTINEFQAKNVSNKI